MICKPAMLTFVTPLLNMLICLEVGSLVHTSKFFDLDVSEHLQMDKKPCCSRHSGRPFMHEYFVVTVWQRIPRTGYLQTMMKHLSVIQGIYTRCRWMIGDGRVTDDNHGCFADG